MIIPCPLDNNLELHDSITVLYLPSRSARSFECREEMGLYSFLRMDTAHDTWEEFVKVSKFNPDDCLIISEMMTYAGDIDQMMEMY